MTSDLPCSRWGWGHCRWRSIKDRRTTLAQAQTLAYVDTFWLLALGAAVMFGLSFVLRKNDPRAGSQVAAH
jgi:hypothetical protein